MIANELLLNILFVKKKYVVLESQRPATGLRTPKSPKVPGRVLGRVPEKGTAGGTAGSSAGRPVSLEKQRNGTAPSSPPSSPLFPGTLPGTFGDLGVLSPVAGRGIPNVVSLIALVVCLFEGNLGEAAKMKSTLGEDHFYFSSGC